MYAGVLGDRECIVGEMLFNTLNMMFTVFVRSDTMPLETLKADISRQNRPSQRRSADRGTVPDVNSCHAGLA